jgi:branched-chain amino acid aminotransferase
MYYNENTIVYYNKEFIKASEVKGDVYSQSLHYGYAVFEGIRAYNTTNGPKIFKPVEHFERMKFSCEAVGIPYPFNNEQLIQSCYDLLVKNNLTDAYIRPLVTCPPNMSLTKAKDAQLLIAAWEWHAYLGHNLLRVVTSSVRRPNAAAFKMEAKVSGHYVNSIMASQEAKDKGYDEALLLDTEGFVAEGPGANFFIEKDGILYTPQKGNILPGITRATIIELCDEAGIEVVEKQITPKEAHDADSAFYCGTAAEVIGFKSLDDVVYKLEWKDTLGAVLQKAYKEKVLEIEPIPKLLTA